MPHMRNIAVIGTFTAWVLAMFPLAGCTPDAAAGQERAAVGGRLGSSYELVTIMKAQSSEKYFALEKAGYDVCVATARFQQRSVKPFPTLPTDGVLSRTTYISDGHSFYQRRIETIVDITETKPDMACLVTIYKSAETQVLHNGKMQQSHSEADGREVVGEAMEGMPEALNEILSIGHTVPKKVNQIALKCKSVEFKIAGRVESCIIDPALGLFTEGSGRPLPAYSRFVELVRKAEVTVEPLSLRVGQRIDPRVFSLPAAK